MGNIDMTAEERLQWWHEARFGMFIHWGLYAILAGEWKGQKTRGIGEWIMHDLKIPIAEYEQLAAQFNPVKFDAEEWAELALQAGMKYLVITAKHHDGFCLFDSPSNPYNIVQQSPFKRDPMKELAEACNKRGIKMCFYYSQAQDWHADGGAGHWEDETEEKGWLVYQRSPEEFQRYLDTVVKPNIKELLTNYGPIGLLWFDTPVGITKGQSEDLRDFVHSLQPACLVSGRVGHDVGDYGSLGDNEHPEGKVEGAWETPATLNDTWGFKTDDHNWKSLDCLIELLVNCASKGVNYLLNVGPTAEGVIPQPSVDLLKQLGAWLDRNGEAIYGTSASPFINDPVWGRVTTKGDMLYLLVKQWPDDDLKLYGLKNKVVSSRILGREDASVRIQQDGDTITLSLPTSAPEETISVIGVKIEGKPEAEDLVIQQGAASITLPVALGELRGEITHHGGRGIAGWIDTTPSVSWKVRIKTRGVYDVVAITRGNNINEGWFGNHMIRVEVGNASVSGVAGMQDYDCSGASIQNIASKRGCINVDAVGETTIRIVAEKIDPAAQRGLALRGIELIARV